MGEASRSHFKVIKQVEKIVAIFTNYHNEVGVISSYFIDDKIRLEYSTVPSRKQTFKNVIK